ncbi:hypothetical protein QJS10_CPB22g00545 [Acorus calamus]|uniref:Uncharacterized protein n=1 Tax=Acorus calamus TaxID=4465 RepID=A0AAV9C3H4_ACOCL|nr:hypothetical protein QJS10_CPB22g00545 [Acorus calamus]
MLPPPPMVPPPNNAAQSIKSKRVPMLRPGYGSVRRPIDLLSNNFKAEKDTHSPHSRPPSRPLLLIQLAFQQNTNRRPCIEYLKTKGANVARLCKYDHPIDRNKTLERIMTDLCRDAPDCQSLRNHADDWGFSCIGPLM